MIVCLNCLNKFHTGVYGYDKPTTPRLDRFADSAYVFTNLVAPATYTPPVIADLLSGRFNPVSKEFIPAQSGPETLADKPVGRYLASQGYRLITKITPENVPAELPAEPFVCWIHLTDLHSPYDRGLDRDGLFDPDELEIYRSALARVTRFELGDARVRTPLFYVSFGPDPNILPENDDGIWNQFLSAARGPRGDPRHDLLRRGMEPRLFRALADPSHGDRLSRDEKVAVVEALNRLAAAPDKTLDRMLLAIANSTTMTSLSDGPRLDLLGTILRFSRAGPLARDPRGGVRMRPMANEAHARRLAFLYCRLLETVYPAIWNPIASPVFFPLAARVAALRAGEQATSRSVTERVMMEKMYDASLRDVDERVGRMLDALDRSGLSARTFVVVMADHGEAFARGGPGHSNVDCYEDVVNAAFLVRPPGGVARRTVVPGQLRTVDVFPTMLDLMGLGAVPDEYGRLDGLSAAPLIAGRPSEIDAFSKNALDTWSVRTPDGWKLIWNRTDDWARLYDLNADPGESADVAAKFPDRAGTLEARLRARALESAGPRP